MMSELQKGKAIRFVKGTCVGCVGWIDKAFKKKKRSPHVDVIVDMDGSLVQKYVKKTSIRDAFARPKSYEEAALQQHNDIETAMIKLAEKFAECGIEDQQEAANLFMMELKHACKLQAKLKVCKCRHVEHVVEG